MSVPLRKDHPEEELSTADLAQSKRSSVARKLRPAPFFRRSHRRFARK